MFEFSSVALRNVLRFAELKFAELYKELFEEVSSILPLFTPQCGIVFPAFTYPLLLI